MKIYEGKAKIIETTEDENLLVQIFKDSLTAFNAEKKDNREGKGGLNNRISTILFEYLQDNIIPTHFMKQIDEKAMLIKRVKIFKVEVVIRNITAGSIVKRLGLKRGEEINPPILEFYYKDDALGDPLINNEHILYLGIANEKEIERISHLSRRVNNLLRVKFDKCGLLLVDLKLEFGTDKEGEILLADEISPDTCRLWDKDTKESLDKDLFREDKGDVLFGYKEVLRRLSL